MCMYVLWKYQCAKLTIHAVGHTKSLPLILYILTCVMAFLDYFKHTMWKLVSQCVYTGTVELKLQRFHCTLHEQSTCNVNSLHNCTCTICWRVYIPVQPMFTVRITHLKNKFPDLVYCGKYELFWQYQKYMSYRFLVCKLLC